MLAFTTIATDRLFHDFEIKRFKINYSQIEHIGIVETNVRLISHISGYEQLFTYSGKKLDPTCGLYFWEYSWVNDRIFPQLQYYRLMIYDDREIR
jgi:hypothetical protein